MGRKWPVSSNRLSVFSWLSCSLLCLKPFFPSTWTGDSHRLTIYIHISTVYTNLNDVFFLWRGMKEKKNWSKFGLDPFSTSVK